MKQFFNKLIKQIKCTHQYEFENRTYKKKLSRSENPFWYTEIYIHLKCSECDKQIKRDYEWCEAFNLPTHEPFGGRMKGRRQ